MLKSTWGPKSVQNAVGNRLGKVIRKRRAKEGLKGKERQKRDLKEPTWGPRWGHVGWKIEEDRAQKRTMEKRSEKKRMVPVDPQKFPGSGARRKPLAKAKGSSEERRNGGLED